MNWGKGIIVAMAAFMTFITVLGVDMFRNTPTDFDRNYYEKGLSYDTVYAKEKQVLTDNAKPLIKVQDDQMQISFIAPANGTLHFERPSDSRLDKTIAFRSDTSNKFTIPLEEFAQGEWQMSFDWKSDGKKYLYNHEMYLP